MDINQFIEARQLIQPYCEITPLYRAEFLEQCLGYSGRIFLKCDHQQRTGSFKLRGALGFLLRLSDEDRKRGVVTRSSGNFAQAIAYAGTLLGISIKIVMAETSSPLKVQRTRDYGAEVIIWGTDTAQGDEKVAEICRLEGRVKTSSFDHLDVIRGQGVVGLELEDQLPTLGTFFCPVSGGGLLPGAATVLKTMNPGCRIIAVEPKGGDDFYQSMQRGERVAISKADTIADGLRILQVGVHNWLLLHQHVDDATLVSDDEIRRAMKLIYEHTGWMIEPSGATSVAGLLNSPLESLQGDVVCILSGGNIDPVVFEREVA